MSEAAGRRPRGGLGRGLNALLGEMAREAPVTPGASQADGVRMLPVSSLAPHPDQPRRRFDDALLDELAGSIAARGLIQPIVVRPNGHQYQIVAGERRWRAAQRAHLHEVPVVVRELSDAETLARFRGIVDYVASLTDSQAFALSEAISGRADRLWALGQRL